MTFPKNNLPTQSQPWTRDVEKRVTNLESSFRSAEVNNVTRDSQALSQIRRLDAAVTNAQTAIDKAQGIIDNIYVTGTEEIDGSVLADNTVNGSVVVNGTLPGGKIQANTITATQIATNYVYAGQINAGQINAGTVNGLNITGGTLSTSGTRRVEISGTNANFYDDSGTLSGRVTAGEDGRAATMYFGTNVSGVFAYNGGIDLEANGAVQVTGGNGFTSAGPITANAGINLNSTNITGVNEISNVVTGGSVTRTVLIGGGTTGASITNGGNFVRTSSSQRYKTDIQLLDINLNDLYELQPKTFKRIEEVEESAESARTYPGFIAEELAGTSLDKFVFYSQDENGNPRPEGIHYPELTAALLLAIKDLNARIEVLESRV